MKRAKHLFIKTILIITGIAGINSCYYDDEENLYPQFGGCDTTNVTYSSTISVIMGANCNTCHSGSAAQSGIKTDNYSDLKIIADNEKLWGAINHETGYSPMPKDRPKISGCDLNKIRIWIEGGALNN